MVTECSHDDFRVIESIRTELKELQGMTSISGPPGCGKTSLLKLLKEASVHVAGFVYCDMSGVLDWHADIANNSPYYDVVMASRPARGKGKLLSDMLVMKCLLHYLRWQHQQLISDPKMGIGLRQACVSGVPRKLEQLGVVEQIFPNHRFVHISIDMNQSDQNRLARIEAGVARDDDHPDVFRERWNTHLTHTHPTVLHARRVMGNRFVDINFRKRLRDKATMTAAHMPIKQEERRSILHQLRADDTKAAALIRQIECPVQKAA